jgi:hypothetical protein
MSKKILDGTASFGIMVNPPLKTLDWVYCPGLLGNARILVISLNRPLYVGMFTVNGASPM